MCFLNVVFARIHCNFKYLVGWFLHYFSDNIILILFLSYYNFLEILLGEKVFLLYYLQISDILHGMSKYFKKFVCLNTFLYMFKHDALCFVLEGSSLVRLERILPLSQL